MTIQTSHIALALTIIAGVASSTAVAGSAGHDSHEKGSEHAGSTHDHGNHSGHKPSMTSGMTQGEVVVVDRENRRVTLKHDRIESHDMPGMTMPFPVGSDVDLSAVEPGDQVRFSLKHGTMMVDKLEPTP